MDNNFAGQLSEYLNIILHILFTLYVWFVGIDAPIEGLLAQVVSIVWYFPTGKIWNISQILDTKSFYSTLPSNDQNNSHNVLN